MQVNDIVLVYENRKGTESKLLLTKRDYVDTFLSGIYSADPSGLAESLWDLEETRESRSLVKEEYIQANYTIRARFCADRDQLRGFLSEKTVSTKEWIPLIAMKSSGECIRMMYSLGFNVDGSNAHIRYKYEPVDMRFGVGGIVHNLNGSDYRIMETYSQSNLLLQDNRTGNFMVAIGIKGYVRYTKMEGYSINDAIYGVEWEHGVYLNTSRPSEVDFAALREEYGKPAATEPNETVRLEDSGPEPLPEWQPPSQPKSDLYLHDREYAMKLGELGEYTDSFRKNIRCKKALEDTLRDGYVDGKLRYNIAVPLADKFGADRVHLILVHSVGLLWYSGGISQENRDWANNEYRVMSERYRDSFILRRDDTNDFVIRPSAMPFCTSAVNAFTDQFRILLEKENPELATDTPKEAGSELGHISNSTQKASHQNKPQQRSPKL